MTARVQPCPLYRVKSVSFQPILAALTIFLLGVASLSAATIVGNSLDLTGSVYAGAVNQIQFLPVATVQSIGTNTYWEATGYSVVQSNGAFAIYLNCGWYDASPVSTSVFGGNTKARRLFVPDSTNVWQFNDCVSLASVAGVLYTNTATSNYPTNAITNGGSFYGTISTPIIFKSLVGAVSNVFSFSDFSNPSFLVWGGTLESAFAGNGAGLTNVSAISGWPTNWPSSSITNAPWLTSVPPTYALLTDATNAAQLAAKQATNGITPFSPSGTISNAQYAVVSGSASNLLGTISAAQLPAGVLTNHATGVALSGTFTGNGGGLTNLAAQTIFNDTNALNFANAAMISDVAARADLIGFVNELKSAGLWSNLVDAALFQTRFNPTNKLSLMMKPIALTNAVFGKWGLSLTNGNTAANVTIPNTITNTQVYFWHIPPSAVDGNAPSHYLGGLANPASGQSLYVCVNGGTAESFRIRNNNSENAPSGNGGQPSWVIPFTIYNYNASFFGRNLVLAYADQKGASAYAYDGSSLSGFSMFWPCHLDYNANVLSTNYALAGLSITSPLTNWIMGTDFKATNTVSTGNSDLLEGLVFNKVLSYSEYKAVYRAVRWLDADSEDLFIGGDSTMATGGNSPSSTTNAPVIYIKQQLLSPYSRLNVIDVSMGGDGYNSWCPFNPLNNNACLTNVWCLSQDFAPVGKVKSRKFIFKAGINDFYSQGTASLAEITNVVWLNNFCITNGFEFQPATIVANATNGSVYPLNTGYEASRTYFNNWLMTNATMFSRVIPAHLIGNPSVVVTNLNYTIDGVHMGGTNGWIINKKLAALFASQQVQQDGWWLLSTNYPQAGYRYTTDGLNFFWDATVPNNGSGITNLASCIQTGTTNATALSAFVATFSQNFADTNYTALAIGNGFALASSYVSSKTISNCVFNMTVATGNIDWTAIHK